MKKIEVINLKDILADEAFNCRGRIMGTDVIDLSKDIEENGLDSPVTIQTWDKDGYKYRLVAGFRRFMAHRVLKKENIECIVREFTDEKEARLMNMRENIIRKELNILQEAKSINRLLAMGMGIKAIAKEFSRSVTWAQVRKDLLDLPEEIQSEAAAGLLNQKQIKQLCKLPTKDMQYAATRKIKDAKFRGDDMPRITPKVKESSHVKRLRKKVEIFYMQMHIQKAISNNIGTRCLAWAAGEISDAEIFNEVEKIAQDKGISYIKPTHSVATLVDHDPRG